MEDKKPDMDSEVTKPQDTHSEVISDMEPQDIHSGAKKLQGTHSADKISATEENTHSEDMRLQQDIHSAVMISVTEPQLVSAVMRHQGTVSAVMRHHQDTISDTMPTEQAQPHLIKSADMGIMMLALLVTLMAVLWVVAISAHIQDLFQWLPSQWLIMEGTKKHDELFQFESHL